MSGRADTPEFSRPFPLERLRAGPEETELVADAEECAALARRLGIPALRSLSCRFRLTLEGGGQVLAQGRLQAVMTRICVASLDEFETGQSDGFRVRFVPHLLDGDGGEAMDLDAEDELPYAAGLLDLGEAAAEQLALVLDPYPRKPEAVVSEAVEAPSGVSPFAALAALRKP